MIPQKKPTTPIPQAAIDHALATLKEVKRSRASALPGHYEGVFDYDDLITAARRAAVSGALHAPHTVPGLANELAKRVTIFIPDTNIVDGVRGATVTPALTAAARTMAGAASPGNATLAPSVVRLAPDGRAYRLDLDALVRAVSEKVLAGCISDETARLETLKELTSNLHDD